MQTKIHWIKTQIRTDESLDDLVTRLNTAVTIPNPITQQQIDRPVDIDAMWEIVPPAEIFKVLNTLLWDRVVRAIQSGNKPLIQRYVGALVAGGALSSTTAGKVGDALTGTVPDPNWQPTITDTPAGLAGFGDVMTYEVQMILDNEKELNVT